MLQRAVEVSWGIMYCGSACVYSIIGVNKELRVLIHGSSSSQPHMTIALQAVRKKGVEPQWEGPGISKTDKGLVYVVDNFDCSDFKLLLGKCR